MFSLSGGNWPNLPPVTPLFTTLNYVEILKIQEMNDKFKTVLQLVQPVVMIEKKVIDGK